MDNVLLGQNGSLMRRHNRSLVLRVLRNQSPISRRRISEQIGLGAATVTNLVAELIEDGLVDEVGSSPARSVEGGRTQVLLGLRPRAALVAGIHFGVRHVLVAVGDLRGTLLKSSAIPRPKGGGPEESVRVAALTLGQMREELGLAGGALLAAGVSTPAIVDADRGMIEHAPELGWPVSVPIAELVERATGMPVVLDNSRRSMLLAESLFGVAQGARNAILLHVATTIGAGLLVDYRIVRGDRNAAARLGHLIVQEGGPRCECGGLGCLNAIAGEQVLVARAARELGRPIHAQELYELAAQGDETSRRLLADAARAIGSALLSTVLLLDCELVVVAGWITAAGAAFLDPLRAVVGEHAERVTGRAPRIVPSMFGADVLVAGAVSLALEKHVYRMAQVRDGRRAAHDVVATN
jgi:predicted NBD/HSP70 family sugar kinase